MAHGVAQALLDDAVDGAVDGSPKLSSGTSTRNVRLGDGRARSDEIVDGVREPDVEQHGGAQAAEDVANVPLHPADGFADDADAVRDLAVPPVLDELLDGHGVDVGGKQQRADLVVQVARGRRAPRPARW